MEPTMWQKTPYTIPLILAALILVVSAIYVWRRHRVTAAKMLAVAFVGGSGWMLGYALELASTGVHVKVFWYKVELLSVVILSIAWLVFTFQYTGHEKWVNRRNLAGLSIIPLITLILIFTNEYHGLVWSRIELITEPFVVSEFIHGVWFWVHTAYSYFLVFCGSFLLFLVLIRSQRLYRWQVGVLLFAAFFPLLHSILNLSGVYTLVHPRVTILLFPVVSLVVAWITFRFRVADIIRVARGAVVDSMSDGVMVLDLQNRIMDVNPIVQQLIGRPTPEILGQPIDQVWPDWNSQTDHFHGEITKEIMVTLKDEQHTYDVRISPLNDWRGGLISQVVVLRDITERKKAEELVHESEEKFRTIFENASDEIVYLDKNGVIIDINKKSEEIFGYKRDEIIGKNFAGLEPIGAEYTDEAIHFFKDVVTNGHPVPTLVELELKHKNGSKVFAEVSHRLIKKNGEVEGILAILRDVTERKLTEEKLKASLKEKEILLQEIHHRVKNNLQVISSLLSLQSAHVRDTEYTEMLRESQNRIRSMALIHENLYQSEDLANVDFEKYIETLIHTLVRSYRVSTDRITVATEVENVFLGVDAAIHCGLIINELVSNSLKHAFPGKKGEITVRLRPVDGAVKLTVSDNGIGIPEDIDFKNTESLGLRLVKILAEHQLKGEIRLDRSGGTAFHITFKEVKSKNTKKK